MNKQDLILLLVTITLFLATGVFPFRQPSKLFGEETEFQKKVGRTGDELTVSATDEITNMNEKDADMSKLFEGDIQKTPNFMKMLRKAKLLKRDAMTKRTWPDGIVPYRFERKFGKNNDGRKVVKEAVDAIMKDTCIKFREYEKGDKDYIAFYHGRGCHSALGMDRSGSYQTISLEHNPGRATCVHKGVVMHELLHALGFFHEQARRDRDKQVRILWKNIKRGMDSQFKMHGLNQAETLGEDYDKGSIMHYGNYAFSKNGKKTIESISDSKEELGQRNGLSEIDVRQLNKLYKCIKKPGDKCKRDNAANGSSSGGGVSSIC